MHKSIQLNSLIRPDLPHYKSNSIKSCISGKLKQSPWYEFEFLPQTMALICTRAHNIGGCSRSRGCVGRSKETHGGRWRLVANGSEGDLLAQRRGTNGLGSHSARWCGARLRELGLKLPVEELRCSSTELGRGMA